MFRIPGTVIMLLLVMILAALLTSCGPSPGSEVKRVDKDTVKGWLDDSAVMIIDVRASDDWEGSDKKIKGAVRQDSNQADSWAKKVPKEKKLVLYCA